MLQNISAISTAAGAGGVAIIRISGPSPLQIAEKMFSPCGKTCVSKFTPNMMYAGKILLNGFSDFGMAVYFKSPKSFTGEDVVEFHCHGGVQIARAVLEKTLSLGARLADRGEFTKRAFINGKLSLASAEGLIDMINAESLACLKASSMLYRENLTKKIQPLQQYLKDILAQIAADSDYPEEDLDGLESAEIEKNIVAAIEKMQPVAQSFKVGKKVKNGVTCAFCGKPNVGKSSLLNAIIGYDKAIVSDEEGTTRDAVEGSKEINGITYNFFDTAGIRENAGFVEEIGVKRAISAQKTADVVICVRDAERDYIVPETNGKIIKVFNKCDKVSPFGEYDIAVSAKSGKGIAELEKLLSSSVSGALLSEGDYIIEERHFNALNRAIQALISARENLKTFPPDVIFTDVKEAWDALGEITGETASEEIINTVFAKFCVGK